MDEWFIPLRRSRRVGQFPYITFSHWRSGEEDTGSWRWRKKRTYGPIRPRVSPRIGHVNKSWHHLGPRTYPRMRRSYNCAGSNYNNAARSKQTDVQIKGVFSLFPGANRRWGPSFADVNAFWPRDFTSLPLFHAVEWRSCGHKIFPRAEL